MACGKVYRHGDCRLPDCECKCHEPPRHLAPEFAADGQPNQVETRCSDCFDGKHCMRLLCNWCWDQYGILGLQNGKLKATDEKPRLVPQTNEAGEDLVDWVRSLNPNKFKASHVVSATPQPIGFTPSLPTGVRRKVQALSSDCGLDPMHHAQCDEAWCECVCHDIERDNNSRPRSLACVAADHGACAHAWCRCKCHKGGD